MNQRTRVLLNTVALSLVVAGGVALAQGVGNPPLSPPQSSPRSSPGAKPDASRQRVVQWFTRYDGIRRAAQMTPDEKSSSHKMMTGALTGDMTEKEAGRQLLSRMVGRYSKAAFDLQSLPEIPETRQLQKGYLQYFKTGKEFFARYLKALNANKPLDMASQLDDGRKQLGLLDISNKALDKKLRKQFNIMPYR